MGRQQIAAGAAVIIAVSIAFSSLEFSSRTETGTVILQQGVYGRLEKPQGSEEIFLFFSSTCPHCEEVIETLDQEFSCSLNFSPIDSLKEFSLPGLVRSSQYLPEINRRFLGNLGVSEIPALLLKSEGEIRVMKGKQAIMEYLEKNCRAEKSGVQIPEESSETSGQNSTSPYFRQIPPDDSCVVDEECEEVPPKGKEQ
jgi:hypothetical protein